MSSVGDLGTKIAVIITLMMEAINSSETSVTTRTTRQDIQKGSILQVTAVKT
jgi:hypothetical protein